MWQSIANVDVFGTDIAEVQPILQMLQNLYCLHL
jgi:hypothetical protein